MAAFTYTAKRSVMDGHDAGTEYTLEIGIEDWTPDSSPDVKTSTTLSGRRFSQLTNIEQTWTVRTLSVNDAATLDQLAEFLDSVAGGEVFTVSPFGTTSYLVTMDGKARWNLVNAVGYYSTSFTVRLFV